MNKLNYWQPNDDASAPQWQKFETTLFDRYKSQFYR